MCLEVGLTGLGTGLHGGQEESFFLSGAADNEGLRPCHRPLWGSGSCSLPFFLIYLEAYRPSLCPEGWTESSCCYTLAQTGRIPPISQMRKLRSLPHSAARGTR